MVNLVDNIKELANHLDQKGRIELADSLENLQMDELGDIELDDCPPCSELDGNQVCPPPRQQFGFKFCWLFQ